MFWLVSPSPISHVHGAHHLSQEHQVYWYIYIYICCLVSRSYPTLCNPINCSPPDSSDHGISQARILEWVAISFSGGSSRPKDGTHISCIGKWILYTTEPMVALYAMRETRVWALGQQDPLEKEVATHSTILAWRISWTEEPGGLQSMGSQRIGHNWAINVKCTKILCTTLRGILKNSDLSVLCPKLLWVRAPTWAWLTFLPSHVCPSRRVESSEAQSPSHVSVRHTASGTNRGP